MHPADTMSQVVNGKRYSVATATLLAHDEYWDGHNFERHFTNTFLYKTPRGNYFKVFMTQHQGARDTITPLPIDEARELYEDLREKEVEVDEAFGVTIEDA